MRLGRRMGNAACRRWFDAAWSWLGSPARLLRLAGLTLAGGLAALFFRTRAAAALETFAGRGALAERFYVFFELYDPLVSWWMILLLLTTALSFVACLQGRVGFHRSRTRVSRLGFLLSAAGAISLPVGAMIERGAGLSGELLLRERQLAEQVYLRSPPGQERLRPLGFSLEVEAFRDGAVEVGFNGTTKLLPTAVPVRVGCVTLEKRLTRIGAGRESFEIAVADKQTGREAVRTAYVEDSIQGPADSVYFEVASYDPDLRGLGPAVRIEEQRNDGDEGVWVFLRYPTFDRDNRVDRYGFTLMSVVAPKEAVVGVSRHPGVPVLSAGGAALLLGVFLSVLGAFWGLSRARERDDA